MNINIYNPYVRKELELYHHGIQGQKWGKRNGPPYPLERSTKSSAEKAKRSLSNGESKLRVSNNTIESNEETKRRIQKYRKNERILDKDICKKSYDHHSFSGKRSDGIKRIDEEYNKKLDDLTYIMQGKFSGKSTQEESDKAWKQFKRTYKEYKLALAKQVVEDLDLPVNKETHKMVYDLLRSYDGEMKDKYWDY